MKIKTRAAAAALAAVLMGQLGAAAAEWINLSAWAYPDVSAFVSAGLLPKKFTGVSDYTRTVNRGEFCELLYAVLSRCGIITDNMASTAQLDGCGDYPAVNRLYSKGLVGRLANEELFEPEKAVTREWAALLMGYMLDRIDFISIFDDDIEAETAARGIVSDIDEMEGDTRRAAIQMIELGVMGSTGSGRFEPKAEMTVEQAVVAVKRMYECLPRVIIPDNETGMTERTLENGLTEVIANGMYTVKDGEKELMTFESDVYIKLLSYTYNGRRLAFAVNFNDKTDVFDLDTKELLYTIPHIVREVDVSKGYAYTMSGRFMPVRSGLYSLESREEILPPEYSRAEINELELNGFSPVSEEKKPSEGWIYYANWNDGGNIYRVDTNGENVSLIAAGHDSSMLSYRNGIIYFRDAITHGLYCVNENGGEVTEISKTDASLQDINIVAFANYERQKTYNNIYTLNGYEESDKGRYMYTESKNVCEDGSVYYIDVHEDAITVERVWNGDPEMKPVTDHFHGHLLYKYTPGKGSEKIADVYTSDIMSPLDGTGTLYFLDAEKLYTQGSSPIYCYDGSELKVIADGYSAKSYGFKCDFDSEGDPWSEDSVIYKDKLCFETEEDYAKGMYHILDLKTGEITSEKLLPASEDPWYNFMELTETDYTEQCGNPEVSVKVDDESRIMKSEYKGTVKSFEKVVPYIIIGDWIYGRSYDQTWYFGTDIGGVRTKRRQGYSLVRCNYKTGELQLVDGDFGNIYECSDGMIVYETRTGMLKAVGADGDAVEIYPNKGLHRYGSVAQICHMPKAIWQKRVLYKVDKNGNVTQLTDTDSENVLYVPNEAEPENLTFK